MTLDQIVSTIAAELRPEKIILFGSHARGEANADSDYDLFVIVPYEGDRYELGARARGSVRGTGVSLDIIVYPKAQLEAFLQDDGSDFLDNVFNEGILVYETPLPQAA